MGFGKYGKFHTFFFFLKPSLSVLKNVIKGANAIVLLINGDEERFDESLQQMMREMQVKEI